MTTQEYNLIQLAGRLAFVLKETRAMGDPVRRVTGGITFELFDDAIAPDVELALALAATARKANRTGGDGRASDDDGMREHGLLGGGSRRGNHQ